MAKHRSHSVAFKRQIAGEFIAGETLHALSKRHDISRQLIRIWVGKLEAGALDDDVQAADLLQSTAFRRLGLGNARTRHADGSGLPSRGMSSLTRWPPVSPPPGRRRAACRDRTAHTFLPCWGFARSAASLQWRRVC